MRNIEKYDTTVLSGSVGDIAGGSMLGDIGAVDGDLDFDSPTAEDLYVAAVALAGDLLGEPPTTASRKIERAALWMARVACNVSGSGSKAGVGE